MAETNEAWFDRARRVLPGGVDSPVRSFASVGGTPYTVVSGEGAYVTDAEGTRYLDLVQSYGAVLLGHAHPVVTEAVAAAAARGTTFGAPTPGEVLLAEAVCERVPGCEQVRLVSSGTEAAMSAVRLARGVTRRDGIVKFDGCYHGHSDGLLAGGGSGVAMLGLPGSVGVSAGAVADTEVVPYNAVPELDARVACVIVEPVAANMNLVAPEPGFLAGLRAACDAAGALLVFDEVITGFRLGPDGATGWSGVTPDLWCFGKVIGGGFPERVPAWPCCSTSGPPTTPRWRRAWSCSPRTSRRRWPREASPSRHRRSVRWSACSWAPRGRGPWSRRRTTRAPASWPAPTSTAASSTPCCAGAWRSPRGPTR